MDKCPPERHFPCLFRSPGTGSLCLAVPDGKPFGPLWRFPWNLVEFWFVGELRWYVFPSASVHQRTSMALERKGARRNLNPADPKEQVVPAHQLAE